MKVLRSALFGYALFQSHAGNALSCRQVWNHISIVEEEGNWSSADEYPPSIEVFQTSDEQRHETADSAVRAQAKILADKMTDADVDSYIVHGKEAGAWSHVDEIGTIADQATYMTSDGSLLYNWNLALARQRSIIAWNMFSDKPWPYGPD